MKALYLIFITIFSLFFWQCSTESQKVDLPPDNKGELSMPDKNKEQKENGDRDTSGFYETYRYTNRFVWQKPDIIINLFGDLSGKTIADIGTGLGYFSLRLAKKAQKVIAIDIDANMTKYIDSIKVLELPEPYQNRLETRLALPMDPKLNTEEVDGAVIVNTYMYIPNRKKYLATLKKGLKPGGRLVIVDFKKKRTPFGPSAESRVPLYLVEKELYETGYTNVSTNDMQLDYQYIIVAEK